MFQKAFKFYISRSRVFCADSKYHIILNLDLTFSRRNLLNIKEKKRKIILTQVESENSSCHQMFLVWK